MPLFSILVCPVLKSKDCFDSVCYCFLGFFNCCLNLLFVFVKLFGLFIEV